MATLYDKLKIIVKYAINADDAKTLLDIKPVIDTKYENNKNALLIADIVVDKQDISVEDIKNAARVIYWKVNDKTNLVNIAGIAWLQDEGARFFTGQILPP